MAVCSGCGGDNPAEHRFCASCGASLLRSCPGCGAAALPDARFCGACGSALDAPAAAAPPPASEPTPEEKLARYVPRALAEKILAARGRIAGERRHVTVLFCDLAESTRIAEGLDPEVYRQLLDAYLEEAIRCVHRYEGVVNQFAGDGFMAIFGAPIAHDDDAGRACRAALDILAELRVLSRSWQERIGQPIRVRIGLNSGPVIVGSVGNDLRMEYSAIGDTTNVASRIEAYAPPGEVCVSESTRKLVAHAFETEEMATEAFKGKQTPTTVYRLVREVPRSERRHQMLRSGLSRYYGRHIELALLRDRYEEASGGKGQIVFVEGEAGIGKSRLAHEFRRQLDAESYEWLEGQAVSYGTRSSYLPIVDLLRGLFDLNESDSAEQIVAKVSRRCVEIGGPVAVAEPFYRDLLGVDPGGNRLEGLSESMKIGFIFEGVRDLIHALAAEKPTIVLIEDLHWVDDSTEQLLRRLFDTLAAARVLAIVTHRSEYAWPHPERSYFSRVRLHGLPGSLVDELAQAVFGETALPSELKRAIAERSDGNPFFIEEVSKALREAAVGEEPGAGQALSEAVPATVQEVILARMDRLDESARHTLQIASVIGREFTVRVLERLAERERASAESLDALSGLELIYEKAVYPEIAYMFKHALTHDVAYQTLLRSQRRELHGQVARLIEELYLDRLPEFYEILAHQYREADVPERAAHYALLAGERAATHRAPEAEHHFRQAMELGEGRPDCEEILVRALAGFGDFQMHLGEVDDANEAFARAIEVANDAKTLRWLGNKVAHRRFVENEGARIAYYVQGEGDEPERQVPIILLHPLIQGSFSFQMLAQRLSQEYSVVYMDPRGSGQSEKGDEQGFDWDLRLRDTLAVLDALPYEKLVFQGDSDGVRQAVELYYEMPERVQQMVLFGHNPCFRMKPDYPYGVPEEDFAQIAPILTEGPVGRAQRVFWNVMNDEPGISAWREIMLEKWDEDSIDEETFHGFFRDNFETDYRHLLPGIRVPTLVMAADRDGIHVDAVRYIADHTPRAQFGLIRGASHMAPFTAMHTFLDMMTTFLRTGELPHEVWEA
jgi:class 3 adenylate cyclase/pimeloyl-ACP methyl ester carboxylesterase